MSRSHLRFLFGISFFLVLLLGLYGVVKGYLNGSFTASNNPGPKIVTTTAELETSTFVSGLEVPWSLVFTSPTRLLIAERPGRIRAFENGKLSASLFTFTDVVSDDEEGLLGMTMHPQYSENKWLYAAYTYRENNELRVKIVRLIDNGDSLTMERVILTNVPAARFHSGMALRFGPDGKLYATTGDATTKEDAQNPNSLAGKILRLNDDGSRPSDNPFETLVWTLGHRNPQGIDWHPETLQWYGTEHGPSGNDGPGGGDELNFLQAGMNYGWPTIHHEQTKRGLLSPLRSFTPAEAPASAHFYTGSLIPQWKNHFFFGALKGEGLWRVVFDSEDPNKILESEKLFANEFGRIRAVMTGPDGALYFSTSNTDGRGKPGENDDRVIRIAPAKTMQ